MPNYLYDVDLYKLNPRRKIKRLYSGITGKELKKIYKNQYDDERELKIHKIYARKNERKLHKVISFDVEKDLAEAIGHINFNYFGIDVDVEAYHDCELYMCDSICRCYTIESAWVENICAESVRGSILSDCRKVLKKYKNKLNDDMLDYCMERIIARDKAIENPDCYHVDYGHGYYGDEINGVFLECYHELAKNLAEVARAKNSFEALKVILNNEYGYIHETFNNLTKCSIKEVNMQDISAGKNGRKLDIETVKGYGNYDGPIGVCVDYGNKYRLMDGFHRHQAALNVGKKKVKIVRAYV
jgi:hypothetical protein